MKTEMITIGMGKNVDKNEYQEDNLLLLQKGAAAAILDLKELAIQSEKIARIVMPAAEALRELGRFFSQLEYPNLTTDKSRLNRYKRIADRIHTRNGQRRKHDGRLTKRVA